MAYNYPYGDSQQLNLEWFISKFNTMVQEWQTAEAGIAGALSDEIARVEAAMTDLYTARDAAIAAKNDAVSAKNAAANSQTAAYGSETSAASSATAALTNGLKSEGFAVGEQNTSPVTSGSPYYQNNAKYYASEASSSASAAASSETNAGTSETNAGNSATAAGQAKTAAETAALEAEGFAVGEQNGSPVTSGSPYYQNNSEYYATQAGNSATAASTSETNAHNSELAAAASAASSDGAAAQAMIADQETSTTAVAAYAIGDYFRLNGVLYTATAAIAIGDTITVGTNCKQAVLADDVTTLKNALTEVTTSTKNLADINEVIIGKAWNNGVNTKRAVLYIPITGGTSYAVSYDTSNFDAIYVFEKATADSTSSLYSTNISSGFTRTANASATYVVIQFNSDSAITESDFDGLDLQFETGTVATPYIQPLSAYDIEARDYYLTYTTPEAYGAYGDGTHDDTAALQAALDSGKNVIANGKYLISSTLTMTPTYKTGQRFIFNQIICSASTLALSLNGRNGFIDGFYLESAGDCVSFGNSAVTYDWDTHFCMLDSGAICIRMGGGGNVSECIVKGERFTYTTVGVNFDLSVGYVGQNTFIGMTFVTEADGGGYAFYANGATYPMTGLTCVNVSLEGAKGGFNFVNSQVSTPITPLYCFGLRTSELTVVNGYTLLRLTGNGIIAGDIFCDILTLDSIDVSSHNPDITLEQSLNFHGRIKGYDRGWRNVRIVGNRVVPEWNEEYAANVASPTYSQANLPYTVNLISGTASWDVDFMFDGTVTFISTANGTTLALNGTTITMNNTEKVTVRTVMDQSDVHVLATRPNGTEIPLLLAT